MTETEIRKRLECVVEQQPYGADQQRLALAVARLLKEDAAVGKKV